MALLHDSLQAAGRVAGYPWRFARYQAVQLAAGAVSSAIGGLCFGQDPRAAWGGCAGLATLAVQQAMAGCVMTRYTTLFNQHLPAAWRATGLSVQSLAGMAAYAAVSPLLGAMADACGLAASLALLALLLGPGFVPAGPVLRAHPAGPTPPP